MLILLKAFSASIEMIIWFLCFSLLIWCIILIDLHILKNPCIPGINPTWSWCIILLICYWILFASICWGFLYLCSSVILVCSFLFLWHLCLEKRKLQTNITSAHGTFSRVDHILGHKSSCGKFKKIEVISSIFSDHNAMRLDINYREKICKKYKHMESKQYTK